ncbi:glycoside hydrolase family 15 protein [Micropruina sonneratiae]|uniref:glycoside hydrolase family 15 protein n=1 Tax=Micropruina sonneratiae TaxID=2986940 RepID=UPI002226030E|nr:glycoside hydrolase family 15 protein [Micropruina sp. KQZ13P-5]MCW3156527.1 glycoside hydrolase family 15 protein [Micropruina sp. KQZ13P-5]
MPTPLEDYALLSDCRTAALVSRHGSIDWLCLPRYDSASVFGAVLGDAEHGRWQLRPTDPDAVVTRRYDDGTFLLITRWTTSGGVTEVHDVLPVDRRRVDVVRRIDLVRRVVGVTGTVEFEQELRFRFDYARAVPWVRQLPGPEPGLLAIAGPDALVYRGAHLEARDHAHAGRFTVTAGETRDLTLTWHPSHHRLPRRLDVDTALERTRRWWQEWADRIDTHEVEHDLVVRSLLVLRALTHRDTGGIIAAPTTSLPEEFGGVRNWDYRFVWLRDAALTLQALIEHGFLRAVEHWRQWLLRAIAGDPSEMQIVYGVAGERDLHERALSHLPGYAGSAPVRIGNGAADQYQADVVGEVLVALHAARLAGLTESSTSWPLERALLGRTLERLDEPDNGIWEIRGEPRFFTHSRVMLWAAFDRGVRAIRNFGLAGPEQDWVAARDRLRAEIDAQGVSPAGHFTQYYGTDEVDASLLVLPTVGFCAADDPRMLATVAVIERELMNDGLVHRYRAESGVDGLAGGEYPFLACSFWLVVQYAASGRHADGLALMRRVCDLANDVGLLSEEYDVDGHRQAGNMPQALSHLALVRAADALAGPHVSGDA